MLNCLLQDAFSIGSYLSHLPIVRNYVRLSANSRCRKELSATNNPRVEIELEHLDQRRLDRDPADLAALAADLDDGTVVGAVKVTDGGAHQFIGAQPRQKRGEDQGAVALHPVAAPPRLRVGAEGTP
jgi:DNA-binding cell septation regulator SpoVG